MFGTMSLWLCGCIKTAGVSGAAAFNVVNAVTNSNPLVTNFTPDVANGHSQEALQYYATANQIPFGSFWESGSYTGETVISISQTSDTMTTLWSGTFDLHIGSIHTLFLSGDTAKLDTLFTTDLIPYYPASDSVAGIRFVNLSRGSLAMTVNIAGNSGAQTEFSDLGYKLPSGFKTYNANSSGPGAYNFEIRDQASDSLLTTYSWTYTLEKSNTVIICGSENVGLVVFDMNNF
jgi:hypothetical protein